MIRRSRVLFLFAVLIPVSSIAQSVTTSITSTVTVQTTDQVVPAAKTRGSYNTGGGNTMVLQKGSAGHFIVQPLKSHYSYFQPGDDVVVPSAGKVNVPNGTYELTVTGCQLRFGNRCKNCVGSTTGSVTPSSPQVYVGVWNGSTCTNPETGAAPYLLANYDVGDTLCGYATASGGSPQQEVMTKCTLTGSCGCTLAP